MREAVLLLLLALATGVPKPPPAATTAAFRPQAWRLPTGKAPSEVEFAAVIAACREQDGRPRGPLAACLAQEFGMHRVP
jgi:hypothetical protein